MPKRKPPADWGAFSEEIRAIAETPFFHASRKELPSTSVSDDVRSIPYDYTPPHVRRADLQEIANALDGALKVLGCLEHRAGQDLMLEPYKFQIAQDLYHGHAFPPRPGSAPDEAFATYPSETIRRIRALRDAARRALEQVVPKHSGNHELRDPDAARRAYLAKNFIMRFEWRYGRLPSNTAGAYALELFEELLRLHGLEVDDTQSVLKSALKKHRDGYSAKAPKARASAAQGVKSRN
jgi:hypothetical protein